MYSINVLEKGCAAVIKFADSCNSDDRKTVSNLYHLTRFARASIRDFPETNVEIDEMFNKLGKLSADLKMKAGTISKSHVVLKGNDGKIEETVPLPITNVHSALISLIREKLNAKAADDYSDLHDIAALYMHRFFELSDKVNDKLDDPNHAVINGILRAFLSEINHHIDWLEKAMRFEEIDFEEIDA